jgi:hypothetical protein
MIERLKADQLFRPNPTDFSAFLEQRACKPSSKGPNAGNGPL